ncbi:methionyl-tRNA formyltransferase [bacterium]|nr:methionyl-tRNA formyltransferase [bacterium]
MNRLRIVFMGSAELACASLSALHSADFVDLLAVVTQPDKPKGRDLKLSPTPVGHLAAQLGLPIHKPSRARDADFIELIRALNPDLMVVVAYGQILPQALLDVPRFGCLNVHTSILPKYRGAAPIQWAIVDGERETGVSIMKMDAGLDTGPVVAEARTAITDDDDSQKLHDRLAAMGAELLIHTIPDFASGRIEPKRQPEEGASYARKITKQDGQIEWSQPARAIFNQIRGFNPWPGAFTHLTVGEKQRLLKIWRAELVDRNGKAPGEVIESTPDRLVIACGLGALRIHELQLEGTRRMSVRDFQSGHALTPGACVG